jgi:hypothetical protein
LVRDSALIDPSSLLDGLREPSGRSPAPSSLVVADVLSSIDDASANVLVRSVLDAAYFSVLNLFDAGFKNSGVGVQIRTEDGDWISDSPTVNLHELYRNKVEPHGSVRIPS